MSQTQRLLSGVMFEFESPSHFRPVGLPVDIRFDGDGSWHVELLRNGQVYSNDYPTREACIAMIAASLSGTPMGAES